MPCSRSWSTRARAPRAKARRRHGRRSKDRTGKGRSGMDHEEMEFVMVGIMLTVWFVGGAAIAIGLWRMLVAVTARPSEDEAPHARHASGGRGATTRADPGETPAQGPWIGSRRSVPAHRRRAAWTPPPHGVATRNEDEIGTRGVRTPTDGLPATAPRRSDPQARLVRGTDLIHERPQTTADGAPDQPGPADPELGGEHVELVKLRRRHAQDEPARGRLPVRVAESPLAGHQSGAYPAEPDRSLRRRRPVRPREGCPGDGVLVRPGDGLSGGVVPCRPSDRYSGGALSGTGSGASRERWEKTRTSACSRRSSGTGSVV